MDSVVAKAHHSLSLTLYHVIYSTDYINMVAYNKEPLFFQERDGPYFPSLRLYHKCAPLALLPIIRCCKDFSRQYVFLFVAADPFFMTKVQVDTGAIKFVLSGANIMCPGLYSAGGRLDTDFAAGHPVVRTLHTRFLLAPCPLLISFLLGHHG
jgi:predicted RNA-binding protein (TIGR00451 family)